MSKVEENEKKYPEVKDGAKIKGKFECFFCKRTLPAALEASPNGGVCIRCIRNQIESLTNDDGDIQGFQFEAYHPKDGTLDDFDIDEWERSLGVKEEKDPEMKNDQKAAYDIMTQMENSQALSPEELDNELRQDLIDGEEVEEDEETEEEEEEETVAVEEFSRQEKHLRSSKTGKKFVAGTGAPKPKQKRRILTIGGKKYIHVGMGSQVKGSTAKAINIGGEWYPFSQLKTEGGGKYTMYYASEYIFRKKMLERPAKEIESLKGKIAESEQKIEELKDFKAEEYTSLTLEEQKARNKRSIEEEEKYIQQYKETIEQWKKKDMQKLLDETFG